MNRATDHSLTLTGAALNAERLNDRLGTSHGLRPWFRSTRWQSALGGLPRIAAWVGVMVAKVRCLRARRRAIRALEAAPDWLLKDIGVARGEIRYRVSGRPPCADE